MAKRFVELSHVLQDGMRVYPGLSRASFGALYDHESSRSHYEGKAEFYIGKADIPLNLGTYLDSPFHRFREGKDLSEITLERVAALDGVVADALVGEDRSIDLDIDFSCVRSRAVLVRTGWDNRFMRDEYWHSGPFLSERCVEALVSAEPVLVGVDFCNIDDAQNPARPAHTRLLRAGILVVEHLCNLGELPRDGFSFYAVPLRILHGASCSVRAFAQFHA